MSAGVPESPEVLRSMIRDAVKFAEEGRASHQAWVEHYTDPEPCGACTPEVIDGVGDIDVQLEWVRKYDVILSVLRASLAPLMVEAIAKISNEEERKQRVRNARHALRYRREARAAEEPPQ